MQLLPFINNLFAVHDVHQLAAPHMSVLSKGERFVVHGATFARLTWMKKNLSQGTSQLCGDESGPRNIVTTL